MTYSNWLYFGCYQQSGHHLFGADMSLPGLDYAARHKLELFDGRLAPQNSTTGYVAALSRLGGFGLSAMSFWDYTGDKRRGSNSTFFAPSLTITPEGLMEGAVLNFPQIWERLPKITWHSSVKDLAA